MSRKRRALYDAIGREEAARIEELRRRSGGRLMQERPRRVKPLACQDLVEQVTDYLEGTVSDELRRRIDAHLEHCPDCTRVLAQWRQVIALAGRLAEDDVDTLAEATRHELLEAFRAQPPAAPD
jgi:hypothetical protein